MSDYFLADDLSGALDAAAAFHHAGRRVTIALSPDEWPDVTAQEVVGITTETRNVTPAAAAEVVTAAIAQGRARGARLLYKKIDSTLRGPVAAELAALAAAMPETRILFCPANPAVGRTVRKGVLRVKGVPVAETEFARDPVCPVRESAIRALLGNAAGTQVLIADAERDEDLVDAVTRMNSADEPWVAVGSGALARPVAALGARPDAVVSLPDRIPPPGPVLFVCGSANQANREQAARLSRACGVSLHEISPRDVQGPVAAALLELRDRGVAALMIESERTESAAALRAMVTAAAAVITGANVARVFVTGGETAFALCRELSVKSLTFLAEIEPGSSLSHAMSVVGWMRWAVKPGGFGDAETWVRGLQALRS
jgi:uncharacterized protein YgbK (DUF1537 family)